jgi:type II secretory pathway pseudopilin PulG
MIEARPHRHGLALIEALIAFAILAFGMLAVMQLQMTMRLNSDIAKQRSEAVRIAQEDMEHARAFSAPSAYEDIASTAQPIEIQGYGANTSYRLTRTVEADDPPGLKTLTVRVEWPDRTGRAHYVGLHSAIDGLDPAASGLLSMAPSASLARSPLGRRPGLPPAARDLGGGRSVFKPSATVAWVFDNASGMITSLCEVSAAEAADMLTSENLKARCSDTRGFLLSGHVNFSGRALDLDIAIQGVDGESLNYQCFDDSPAAAVTYYCTVFTANRADWAGMSTLQPRGWALGTASGQFKVCRYTYDYNRDGKVQNIEHPLVYGKNVADGRVSSPLNNQNFLVVDGLAACPSGEAGTATLEHQPDGVQTSPTPQ